MGCSQVMEPGPIFFFRPFSLRGEITFLFAVFCFFCISLNQKILPVFFWGLGFFFAPLKPISFIKKIFQSSLVGSLFYEKAPNLFFYSRLFFEL